MKATRSIIAAASALVAAAALGLPAAAHAGNGGKDHGGYHDRYERHYDGRDHGARWVPPGQAKKGWKYGYHGAPVVVYRPPVVYRPAVVYRPPVVYRPAVVYPPAPVISYPPAYGGYGGTFSITIGGNF